MSHHLRRLKSAARPVSALLIACLLMVTAAAQPYGLHYAPDPSSQSIYTIGGNVAFNAGGAHCLKYGMTSNHVLGLKAVLATGEVVEFGSESRESVGPDWTGLFVGHEGLFGVALEVTLQLLPRAEVFHTVLAGYRTLEQAGDAVAAVVASALIDTLKQNLDGEGRAKPGAVRAVLDQVRALSEAVRAARCGADAGSRVA